MNTCTKTSCMSSNQVDSKNCVTLFFIIIGYLIEQNMSCHLKKIQYKCLLELKADQLDS